MIGKIRGKLAEVEGNEGLVETSSGVYYKLFLTPEIVERHQIGSEILIYTYLHVREDDLVLFGFEDKKKYLLFKMLLGVDGVGPKLAFAIVSFTGAKTIIDAVSNSDYTFFATIPGIGKKTAQKILLELSGKFGAEFDVSGMVLSQDDATVVDALVSLGFEKHQSQKIIARLDKTHPLEEKIRQAIQLLTNKK